MKRIIISHKLGETCAVVTKDDEVKAIRISRGEPKLIGNVYRGRVKNILPGMQAAFVDIGRDKNVFLQFGKTLKISVGQSILIQIEKDEIGSKGARATLNISLAGRLLIFLPTLNYVGVSSKIRDMERERLHAVAKKIRPKNTGLIVRTAAEGCDENTLLEELARLQEIWIEIQKKFSKSNSPALLYGNNDLIEKIIRDEFTSETEIIVDNLKIYRKLVKFVDNVNFYEGDKHIFENFGVAEEISKLSWRELTLPSGGRIVIDKTEALTAIDVNTGKFIGETNFCETILKTNLEAAELILKQLKLRDIGGIIIVDFIDMTSSEHKKILMNFLRELAACDRNKTKIIDMTPLGLVEITRHSS